MVTNLYCGLVVYALKMKAMHSSETLATTYKTKGHLNQQDHNPNPDLLDAIRSTVVGTKPCVPRPLEVKGKWIRRLGGVAEMKAESVQTTNIISQWQYLQLAVSGNILGFRSTCVYFPSTRKLVT
jgi:hypothetical protein